MNKTVFTALYFLYFHCHMIFVPPEIIVLLILVAAVIAILGNAIALYRLLRPK